MNNKIKGKEGDRHAFPIFHSLAWFGPNRKIGKEPLSPFSPRTKL